ncbi:MAG: hypothetical protein AB7K04_00480 [Pseudorhodoplanes sp.]
MLSLAATACLIALVVLSPQIVDAGRLLFNQDEPVVLADRELAQRFDAGVAEREIEAALAAKDADLARSFVELARDRDVTLPPALAARVDEAVAAASSNTATAESFARGLIIGEPDDMVGLAGATLGDLFVYGDIRDAVREGSRWLAGEPADQLVLGLSCIGLAVTAGTYALAGAGAPARVGLSVVKAARKTGRISARMGSWVSRSVREVVDWSELRRALAGASLADPALAVRVAREAVKVEKAEGLLRLAGDVGKVQTRAGTQAALDGLRLAESPREMRRIARLAEAKGGKTRAILKFVGRSAIALSVATFDLALWLFAALMTLWGFVSSCKGAVERGTLRYLQRRKARQLRARERRLAATEMSA